MHESAHARNAESWEGRSSRFLSEASVVLSSSLDYETTLTNIANLAVTDFAEWCSVDVLLDDGTLDKVVVAHADPDMVEWALAFAAKYPTDLNSNTGVAAVLRTGESLLVSDVTDEMIAAGVSDPDQLRDIRKIGIGSVILVALNAGGRTLGAITFVDSERGRFGDQDFQMAKDLARRAALALDNSRLYTRAQKEIQERIRVENALRESEARFRELADAMPVMVWIARPNQGVGFTNHYYHAYSGLGEEGRGEGGWATVVHPEDRPAARTSYSRSIQTNTVWEQELRLRRHDGEYRWHLSRAVPILDDEGCVLRWYGTSTDIHEQKLLSQELEKRVALRTHDLELAVEEAQSFNYAISHDLRAPLRSVVSGSEILLEELGDSLSGEHRHLLERQVANGLKLSTLLDQLLNLSRLSRTEIRRETIDLTAVAEDIADQLRKSARVPEECRIEIQPGMRVFADPNLLPLLLHSLMENACKFSREGDLITVSQTGRTYSVSDTGIGFDMAYVDKIFMPFERLVPGDAFEGTGIGLALADRIVRRHDGKLWAVAAPGKGATFFFELSVH